MSALLSYQRGPFGVLRSRDMVGQEKGKQRPGDESLLPVCSQLLRWWSREAVWPSVSEELLSGLLNPLCGVQVPCVELCFERI